MANRSDFSQTYQIYTSVQRVVRRDAGVPLLSQVLVGLLIVIVIIVLLLSQEDPEVGMAP